MKMPLFQRAPNCEQRGWPGTFQVKIVVVAKVNYLHKQPGSDSVSIRLTGADCFRVPQNGNNARLRWLRWTEFRQGFQGNFSQRLTSMNKKYPNHVLLISATVGAIYSRTTQKNFSCCRSLISDDQQEKGEGFKARRDIQIHYWYDTNTYNWVLSE